MAEGSSSTDPNSVQVVLKIIHTVSKENPSDPIKAKILNTFDFNFRYHRTIRFTMKTIPIKVSSLKQVQATEKLFRILYILR